MGGGGACGFAGAGAGADGVVDGSAGLVEGGGAVSGAFCQARGGDEELRLQCIREPHDDPWHLDGPERWWISTPSKEEES